MWKCESQLSGGSLMCGRVGLGSGGGQVGSALVGLLCAVMSAFPVRNSIAAHRHAAIDDDLGAGDEARLVGGEKKRRIGGIAPVAHEAKRNARHAFLQQRLDVAAGALPREPHLDPRGM